MDPVRAGQQAPTNQGGGAQQQQQAQGDPSQSPQAQNFAQVLLQTVFKKMLDESLENAQSE
jgi:hypothetical protein